MLTLASYLVAIDSVSGVLFRCYPGQSLLSFNSWEHWLDARFGEGRFCTNVTIDQALNNPQSAAFNTFTNEFIIADTGNDVLVRTNFSGIGNPYLFSDSLRLDWFEINPPKRTCIGHCWRARDRRWSVFESNKGVGEWTYGRSHCCWCGKQSNSIVECNRKLHENPCELDLTFTAPQYADRLQIRRCLHYHLFGRNQSGANLQHDGR